MSRADFSDSVMHFLERNRYPAHLCRAFAHLSSTCASFVNSERSVALIQKRFNFVSMKTSCDDNHTSFSSGGLPTFYIGAWFIIACIHSTTDGHFPGLRNHSENRALAARNTSLHNLFTVSLAQAHKRLSRDGLSLHQA